MKKVARLSNLPKGQKARIQGFTDKDTGLKMIELGCIPGREIQMVRYAPLGDPIAVFCAGTLVSLRLSEASTILIEPA